MMILLEYNSHLGTQIVSSELVLNVQVPSNLSIPSAGLQSGVDYPFWMRRSPFNLLILSTASQPGTVSS